MDRDFAEPLTTDALSRVAVLSRAHFIRTFARTFGEPPHRYLARRRIERAAWLLRTTELPVTRIAHEVGYESLGTFSRTFRRLVGETPSQHRRRGDFGPVPSCVVRAWMRPGTHGEALATPPP